MKTPIDVLQKQIRNSRSITIIRSISYFINGFFVLLGVGLFIILIYKNNNTNNTHYSFIWNQFHSYEKATQLLFFFSFLLVLFGMFGIFVFKRHRILLYTIYAVLICATLIIFFILFFMFIDLSSSNQNGYTYYFEKVWNKTYTKFPKTLCLFQQRMDCTGLYHSCATYNNFEKEKFFNSKNCLRNCSINSSVPCIEALQKNIQDHFYSLYFFFFFPLIILFISLLLVCIFIVVERNILWNVLLEKNYEAAFNEEK